MPHIKNIKQLTSPFDQPIQALEKPSQSNQLSLINSIYKNIETLKKDDINIVDDRVKVLQANLNEYNSLTSSNLSLDIDGRIGPITKSAIFDFEKSTEFDSNYDIKSNEIDLEVDQNLTLTSKVNTKMSNMLEKKAPSFSNKIIIKPLFGDKSEGFFSQLWASRALFPAAGAFFSQFLPRFT